MVTPVQEPLADARARRRRGVRGQAFDMLLGCFAGSIGASNATLFIRELDGQVRVAGTWTGDGAANPAPVARDRLVDQVLETGSALVESASGLEARGSSAVAAGFSSDRRPLGAIHAGFEPPSERPDRELIWAADQYARLAALCASDLAVAAVLGSAGFDPLTGCLSYAGLIEVLEAEIERSRRSGHRLSCCMVEIEGFDAVNDANGSIGGSRVLTVAGEALAAVGAPLRRRRSLRHRPLRGRPAGGGRSRAHGRRRSAAEGDVLGCSQRDLDRGRSLRRACPVGWPERTIGPDRGGRTGDPRGEGARAGAHRRMGRTRTRSLS